MTVKIDFHIHTKYSPDSLTRLRDLGRKSERLGIIPALTDHYSIESHAEARSIGMDFIPGEEILTDKGDLIGLYVSELIPKRVPFAEALDRIREQGGIAYLPHMFDYGRSGKHASEGEAARVDVIEVFNARCISQEPNRKAEAFAEKHGLLKAAGSDSHNLFEFGATYTELPDFDIDSPKALLKALGRAKLVKRPTSVLTRPITRMIYYSKKALWSLGIKNPDPAKRL